MNATKINNSEIWNMAELAIAMIQIAFLIRVITKLVKTVNRKEPKERNPELANKEPKTATTTNTTN